MKLGFWARKVNRIEQQKQSVVSRIKRLINSEKVLLDKLVLLRENLAIEEAKLLTLEGVLKNAQRNQLYEKSS